MLISGTTSTKAYPLLPNSSVRAVTVLSIASELYFSSISTSINLLKSSALTSAISETISTFLTVYFLPSSTTKVKVKDFSGQFAYCIEDNNLKDYISSLEELDELEKGEFRFSDMDSDSYVYFEKTMYGHMKISGQLGFTFRNNYLMFDMEADQTVITNLIKRLK